MLRIGIVGQPGCGKTALFKALAPSAEVEVGAGGKREVHIGQARVPDPRLDELNRVFQRPKQVNAVVEYVDVVGFSRGEASRSGYEAQFLGDIRTCEALMHVLRHFEIPGRPNPDPLRDHRADFEEFLLSDQIILEKRLERLQRDVQKNPLPEYTAEISLMERCLATLSEEKPLRSLDFSAQDLSFLKAYQPLTAKPELVVINLSEDDIGQAEKIITDYRAKIGAPGVEVSAACASLEMEIAELDPESAREFMDDLGIETSALERLIQASHRLLGLISFFTVGDEEVRAWTIPRGTAAREAAGSVHSDMERGFIRAEVVNFADFQPRGSFAACRSDGVLRLEGKDYVVQDGDIIQFRFAV
jgi:hypothetical protein